MIRKSAYASTLIGGFYLFASGVWLNVFEKGVISVCMIMRDETSFILLFIGVFSF